MHNQHTNVDGVSITMLQNRKLLHGNNIYIYIYIYIYIQRIFHNHIVQHG